jgi:hypothetical protein
MCVVCVLCLIVVPLPPGENPFAVKINIYLLFNLEDGSDVSIRRVRLAPNYTALQPRRRYLLFIAIVARTPESAFIVTAGTCLV